MKELIEPIQSDTPLAKAFNRVMAKMQLIMLNRKRKNALV